MEANISVVENDFYNKGLDVGKAILASEREKFEASESFGYFIVPFWINKYKSLKKHLSGIVKETINKNETPYDFQYLFKYVKNIFDASEYFEIDKSKLCEEDLKSIFPIQDVDTGKSYNANLLDISIYLMDKTKGFLLFKVDYNAMTEEDLKYFVYYFSHIGNSYNENNSKISTTFSKIVAEILKFKDYKTFTKTKGDFTTPFYYIAKKGNCVCPVLQLVKRDFSAMSDEEYKKYCYCIGRGYYSTENLTEERINNNGNVDMIFQPTTSTKWFGNQRNLVCVCNTAIKDTLQKNAASNIEQNYIYLYLTLLNQRFTLLTYMSQLVELKTKSGKLAKIYDKISEFKLLESFKTISDEFAYQNIYSQMYRILDIDDLMNDINEISLKVREQKSRKLENLFKMFTVISAIATFYKIFDVLCPFILNSIKSSKGEWLRELLESLFGLKISLEPVTNEMLRVQLLSIVLCLLVTAIFWVGFMIVPKLSYKKK